MWSKEVRRRVLDPTQVQSDHETCRNPKDGKEEGPWASLETDARAIPLSEFANGANFRRNLQSDKRNCLDPSLSLMSCARRKSRNSRKPHIFNLP